MKESKFFEEVIALGRIEQARESVLQVLAVRFGDEAAEEFREAVRGVEDLEQLSDLLRSAIKCRRLTEFRRKMAAPA